jgi:hypothetical protein
MNMSRENRMRNNGRPFDAERADIIPVSDKTTFYNTHFLISIIEEILCYFLGSF